MKKLTLWIVCLILVLLVSASPAYSATVQKVSPPSSQKSKTLQKTAKTTTSAAKTSPVKATAKPKVAKSVKGLKAGSYVSVLNKLSPRNKKVLQMQSVNAVAAYANRLGGFLQTIKLAAVDADPALKIQIMQAANQAEDSLFVISSRFYGGDNFGEALDFGDLDLGEDFVGPIVDLIFDLVIPDELLSIDLSELMAEMQAMADFFFSMGVVNMDPIASVTLGYGTANYYNSDGELIGTSTTESRPSSGGGSTLRMGNEFTCRHPSCGGDGKRYKKDKDGKWVPADICADCGWLTGLNSDPNEFITDMINSNFINMNGLLTTLQNLNLNLQNYLNQVPSQTQTGN